MIITILMLICILMDIKEIHYVWEERLKLKESTLKRWTKQTPRDMQPSELHCADSSKTTDRPSPSVNRLVLLRRLFVEATELFRFRRARES